MTGRSFHSRSDLPRPPAPHGASLFLDFDGTLVELAARPDAVIVTAAARRALAAVGASFAGRVAIVSGRSLDVLAALLGVDLAEQLTLVGSHGVEVRRPGLGDLPIAPPATLAAATAELADFARRYDLVFETKTLGAALHYRETPDLAAAADAWATEVAARHDLVLQRGKMMAEVRVAGSKGDAVDGLMATVPFHGTLPYMVGDDVTDEAGFEAAARWGGAGVLVGEMRATAAHYRLPDVAAVIGWIEGAAQAAIAA